MLKLEAFFFFYCPKMKALEGFLDSGLKPLSVF